MNLNLPLTNITKNVFALKLAAIIFLGVIAGHPPIALATDSYQEGAPHWHIELDKIPKTDDEKKEFLKKAFVQIRKASAEKNEANFQRLLKYQKDVIGIEIILADGTKNHIESRWGHLLLRFKTANDDFWATDTVIGFVADINEQMDSVSKTLKVYSKAIAGGYPIGMQIGTLGDFWDQYVNQDSRSLVRYIVPTTQSTRDALFTVLRQWHDAKNPKDGAGNYAFFSRNCAGVVESLLSLIQLPAKGSTIIPANIPSWMEASLLTPWPELRMVSMRPLQQKIAGFMQPILEKYKSQESDAFDDETFAAFTKNLSTLEIAQFFHMTDKTKLSLGLIRKFIPIVKQVPYQQALSYQFASSQFYEMCFDFNCANSLQEEAANTWTKSKLDEKFKQNEVAFREFKPEHTSYSTQIRDYYNQLYVLISSH